MSKTNPFNFIDPLLTRYPLTRSTLCEDNEIFEKRITYFNGTRQMAKMRWAYDSHFSVTGEFDTKQRRADRPNMNGIFESIAREVDNISI